MPEHAVLGYVKHLPDEDMALDEIEDPLIEAIERAGVGEFDGNGIGTDGAELFMYGPDGEALWQIVEPAPGAPGARSRSHGRGLVGT